MDSKKTSTSTQKKRKSKKSLFKRTAAWLHLWLGLGSGIIVVIVSLTGCMYVFENEIKDFIEDWRFVTPQEKAYLLPSQLISIADKQMKGKHATSVTFGDKDEAVFVGYFTPKKEKKEENRDKKETLQKEGNQTNTNNLALKDKPKEKEAKSKKRKKGTTTNVYMNPYTGEVLNIKSFSREDPDFFRFMLNGHRALWLPYDIGRPIIGVAILIFVVILLTGIVLWWPVKWIKSIRDKSFKIKWSASFKRVNYDMHNVLGFYSMFFLLIISITGLVWSFDWFSKSVYWITSGGKPLVENRESPKSDTTHVKAFHVSTIDKVVLKLAKENPQAAGILVTVPEKPSDAIGAFVYKKSHTFYNMDRFSFDQQSLKEISIKTAFTGKYEDASLPDKIRRMNYDIHVGAVLGLTGKFLAFFASLICASLPITGFLIWWGKRKNSKKTPKKVVKQPVKKVIAPKVKELEEEMTY